jgi:acid phosphatase
VSIICHSHGGILSQRLCFGIRRYPEVASFAGWVALHSKFQNSTFTAEGPLAFLPSWQLPLDDPTNQASFLSVTGAGEAFALGVNLRKRYGLTKGGETFTIW